ncbi:hypothetical protein [Thermospira aquatica]|uniref:Uncharacterized protein n=1 Tax=Thermospira aquatica TaxID=2828656 RepID=A0AAX3BF05_9SPIR|nr:hypothetical protein [Thermospira aquatica]URA10877.1 hypothetical protein KDW03_03475 [Thermospira aquatica]
MPKMKISGQTQGRLVFAYDIREGHIPYDVLLPALNKLLAKMGYQHEATPQDLEEIIGELLYQTNERVFMNLEQLFSEGKFTHSNIEEILFQAIQTVMKERK